MKLSEALEAIDRIKPNAYDNLDKIRWVSELDHSVYADVVKRKIDGPEEEFVPYEYGVDEGRELLIPSPYSEIYLTYLAARIDFYNSDSLSYQNNMLMFNSLYDEFTAWWTRNHMPKQENKITV